MTRTGNKPQIPEGFAELSPGDVIGTDDKIWSWGRGPWKYVGGSTIGTRYQRPTAETNSHWTIIRERNAYEHRPLPVGDRLHA